MATPSVRAFVAAVALVGLLAGCTSQELQGTSDLPGPAQVPNVSDAGVVDEGPRPQLPASVAWRDACLFTSEEVRAAFAPKLLAVAEPADEGGRDVNFVGCAYVTTVDAPEPTMHMDLLVRLHPYGQDLGYEGLGPFLLFRADDRASAHANACREGQRIGAASCGTGRAGDWIVTADRDAWVFRDDVAVELFASGGGDVEPRLVPGLRQLVRTVADDS